MDAVLFSWRGSTLFCIGACAVLVLLWLPGVGNPVVSDTVFYARLGHSLWAEGQYVLDGVPYAKHLPLHALLSYPLVVLFGVRLGMHFSSLLGGFGVLVTTFFLVSRLISRRIGALTMLAVLLHPGFLFMTVVGSADLLFTTLFLAILLALSYGEESPLCLCTAGILAGLASLTRYNGLPFFLLIIVYAFFCRRSLLRSPWLWGGVLLGSFFPGLWLLRNTVVFGNPFFTSYTMELVAESDGPIRQFLSNSWYYTLPHHNVFALFPFALFGFLMYARKLPLLTAGIVVAEALTALWWVQAIRFAFPGYVPLLAFAVLGLLFLVHRFPFRMLWIPILTIVAAMQGFSLCLYTYGACNAWFDRTIGLLPRDMKLSTEGFYTWNQARDALNARAPKGATVQVGDEIVWNTGIFRSDLRIVADGCPAYRITQRPEAQEEIVSATRDVPVTYVTLQRCP